MPKLLAECLLPFGDSRADGLSSTHGHSEEFVGSLLWLVPGKSDNVRIPWVLHSPAPLSTRLTVAQWVLLVEQLSQTPV